MALFFISKREQERQRNQGNTCTVVLWTLPPECSQRFYSELRSHVQKSKSSWASVHPRLCPSQSWHWGHFLSPAQGAQPSSQLLDHKCDQCFCQCSWASQLSTREWQQTSESSTRGVALDTSLWKDSFSKGWNPAALQNHSAPQPACYNAEPA